MSEDVTLDAFVNGSGSNVSRDNLMTSLDETSVGNIPSDWSAVRLAELTKDTLYGANESAEDYDPNRPRYIRIKDIDERGRLKESDKASLSPDKAEGYLLEKGDMLFARSGSPGRTYLHRHNTGEYCYGGYSIKHELISEGLNQEYLSQYTKSQKYWNWIKRIARTGAQANINSGEYASLLVPLPSLPEQRKIATVLYTVDQAIAKTEEVIEQKERVRTGFMQDIFTGSGTESTKPVRLSAVDTEIPEHWEVKAVGKVSTQITDGAHLTPDRSEDGYLLLSARNVKNGFLDLSDVDYVPKEEYKRLIEKCNPEPGNILISCSGTIGRVCEVPDNLDFALVRSAALVKFDNSILSNYAEKVLQSIGVQKQMMGYQTQSAQPNLFQGQIASLEIPIPPMEEQRIIAERLENVGESINADKKYKSQLKRLKTGLMQDLISGTVRTTNTNIQVPGKVAQHG